MKMVFKMLVGLAQYFLIAYLFLLSICDKLFKKGMRLLALLSVAVLFFYSYSYAQVPTINTQSTANLLEPDARRWSGTFGTGYWQGSTQPGPPASDPNMIPSGSGFIWGGNANILNTTIAINEATTQEGIQVTGYSYKWKVKNANANIFTKQPGIDNFVITVTVYDAQGNVYATYHYDYSHSHNWTEHSGSETFKDPFLPPSYFSNIVVSAQGSDSENWQGWYGPEFKVQDSSLTLTLETNPCHDNPLYDQECPVYTNSSSSSSTAIKTPTEAFTEVKDDIGLKMKSNTTKQIRSFASATTAVVSSARGRVFSKRVSSSPSGGASRSSGGGPRSGGSGGGSGSGTNSTGGANSSDGGGSSGGGTDGGGSDSNDSSNDSDTESSFDLRSSTRGTNASGKINGVLRSADGKLTRYTETQFSYTKSENETETGSASSQVIFERERSEELTLGHFLGFSLSKNSTVDTNTTDIESVGLQIGTYFVRNMTEDLFVDGYVAASLLTNNMEVTTSSMTAEADYISRMAATGLAVTGSFDVDRWNILPTFAVDYSVVSSQEAAFEVTSGAGNSNELSSPGNVRQLSLTFSPDFRTSFDYYDGYWSQGSTFSVKPKVTCQRIDQDTITEECGQGATVSVVSQDESQMKTLSFTLGIDTISNDTTYSANALYKVEF